MTYTIDFKKAHKSQVDSHDCSKNKKCIRCDRETCELCAIIKGSDFHHVCWTCENIEIPTDEPFIREWFWRRMKRSPDWDRGYFETWISRFNQYQGRPIWGYMDTDSKLHLRILLDKRSRK